jgi:hypothetical protein
MMHNENELFRVKGVTGNCTEEMVIALGYDPNKRYRNFECSRGMGSIRSDSTIKINTPEGIKIGYTVGEKTWFDTKEERDEYRTRLHAERNELIHRNKMLRKIMATYQAKTTEELEKIIEKIEKNS